MKKYFSYDESNPGELIFRLLVVFGVILTCYGFFWDTPAGVLRGTLKIMISKSALITDSMTVGGVGAAFTNAGLVTLFSMGLIKWFKAPCTGITIAAAFLMAGFSLFGKDLVNILPIIAGGWLYSKVQKEGFYRYLYISLFGTSLSPMVTELAFLFPAHPWLSVLLAAAVGILVGFLIIPVSIFTVGVHQGFNLYNVGFASGLL